MEDRDAQLAALQDRLGHRFANLPLLEQALTHPSVAHELNASVLHNQRLEFLGDSVLGLALTRELYETFPQFDEGPLTKARAQMVNRRSLAEQGRRLGIGPLLIVSRGEETSGGRSRQSSLADAYEAVVGALFLDAGFEAARLFVVSCFRQAFEQIGVLPQLDNPKGELQEVLQGNSSEAPSYEVLSSTGPDHDPEFECVVRHEQKELGRGRGKSKKAAESEAALDALKRLRK